MILHNIEPKKPKMLFFDYGQTLLHEPSNNVLNGDRAVLEHAVNNPNNVAAEELVEAAAEISAELRTHGIGGGSASLMCDVQAADFNRLLYETLGITFDVPYSEIERIFWDAFAPWEYMDGVRETLASLKGAFRMGVISNMSFSGDALRARLHNAFPDDPFEFVITSSDYIFRKPSPRIFRAALAKAKLEPSEVWHIGDNSAADVEGAHCVGITPVWMNPKNIQKPAHTLNPPPDIHKPAAPDVPHIEIEGWLDFADLLNSI